MDRIVRSLNIIRALPWDSIFDIRDIVTLLDFIGITGWAIIIGLTAIASIATAVFAQTKLNDMVNVHAYIPFWGASLWPGIVGTIIGTIAGLIRARRQRPLNHEQWLRLLQDIFCRFLTLICISFATAGFSYLQHKDDHLCPPPAPQSSPSPSLSSLLA